MFCGLVLLLHFLQAIETVSTRMTHWIVECHHHKYSQHVPDGLLAAKEGPQVLLAKVKNAVGQDWYILLSIYTHPLQIYGVIVSYHSYARDSVPYGIVSLISIFKIWHVC